MKYLGILIDNNFFWKYYIDYILFKVSKGIGIIVRLRYFVLFVIFFNIYCFLIEFYIFYGFIVWG